MRTSKPKGRAGTPVGKKKIKTLKVRDIARLYIFVDLFCEPHVASVVGQVALRYVVFATARGVVPYSDEDGAAVNPTFPFAVSVLRRTRRRCWNAVGES